ncbi:EthD family reductase [Nocardioides bruguierae]|uniref:EthD family reductase n=1 Tax=Nocardioides bruguierae TaxID=2945102 RepID=A0A9X2IFD0_9ACTN|nr:EthD family reductase [Nocardioides bruguierae]MCM0621202.1 EthD family reductase [Nocardioides bruguierae]
MATLTVLYGTPTDAEAFRTHYEQVHVPLALALPGAKDPRYSLDVTTLAGEPVFAMFSADFATPEALEAAMGSPEGQAAQADVPTFATGGVTILVS